MGFRGHRVEKDLSQSLNLMICAHRFDATTYFLSLRSDYSFAGIFPDKLPQILP